MERFWFFFFKYHRTRNSPQYKELVLKKSKGKKNERKKKIEINKFGIFPEDNPQFFIETKFIDGPPLFQRKSQLLKLKKKL